ncbi:hypothetical protein KFU94_63660 [Chloroflexi bacterium TSY]|nr:hypothetical protein [Chloroflexi bacterium TSY]
MNLPQKIRAKYFVHDPSTIDLPAFIPIFQRWIQESKLEGLLIDVADYSHVQNGPGILLIGHEADYAMDMADGRPGMIYNRKREWEDVETSEYALQNRLRVVLRSVLIACQVAEQDPDLSDKVSFRTGELELTFLDRLNTPNQTEQFEAIKGEIRAVVAPLYGHRETTIEMKYDDQRRPLTVRVHITDAPNVSTLLEHLEPVTA